MGAPAQPEDIRKDVPHLLASVIAQESESVATSCGPTNDSLIFLWRK